MKFARCIALLCILIPVVTISPFKPDSISKSSAQPASSKNSFHRTEQHSRTRLIENYGKLPLRFEANEGQSGNQAKFISRGSGYALFLSDQEAVLGLQNKPNDRSRATDGGRRNGETSQSAVIKMGFVNSRSNPRVIPLDEMPTKSNYFLGNNPQKWRTQVHNFARVKYEELYPGIDLVWYGNQQQLEHDFIVAPGADPRRIQLRFTGAREMKIDEEGSLVLQAEGGDLRLLKPKAWQEVDGGRREVSCNYRINRSRQIEFQLGRYDARRDLIIDPVLVYSTYLGGSGLDLGVDIAVDSEGNAYLTGVTDSINFPGPSPIQNNAGGQHEVFVLKLDRSGMGAVYATWLGGNGMDTADGIAIDAMKNVVIVGRTDSSNFPTLNPLQSGLNGAVDAFITKINASGSALIYSTYFGGTGYDDARDLAIDNHGDVYFTGSTDSTDFPVINGFQTSRQGVGAYAILDGQENWKAIGSGLNGASLRDLVIDPLNSATLYGSTERGVFKSTDSGNSWGQLGDGQFNRPVNQLVVDPIDPSNLYAVSSNMLFRSADGGETWSQKNILQIQTIAIDPLTPATLYAGTFTGLSKSLDGGETWAPLQITSFNGSVNAIAVDPSTPTTIYAGTINGLYKSTNGGVNWSPSFTNTSETVRTSGRIAISPSNPMTIYISVNSNSIYKTTNAGSSWKQLDTPFLGPQDSLVLLGALVVDPTNSDTVYLGFPGIYTGAILIAGNGTQSPSPAVASRSSFNALDSETRGRGVYKTTDGGATWNPINNGLKNFGLNSIAIDRNAPNKIFAGVVSGTDAYLVKLNAAGSAIVYSSYLGGSDTESGSSIAVDAEGSAYIAGETRSIDFPVVNALQSANGGLSDVFVAKINPLGSAVVWATYLGGEDSDDGIGLALDSKGGVYLAGSTRSSNFPVTKSTAAQGELKGMTDVFVSRLSADGVRLDYSTFLGGSNQDRAGGIAVDSGGNAHVVGYTMSIDFPIAQAVQPARGGNPGSPIPDAFVTKLNPQGSKFIYSTYLGGRSVEFGNSIAVDSGGNAYVLGETTSRDFPAINSTYKGALDAFVTKLGINADLSIDMTDAPDPVMVNNQLTYTVSIVNNGPDTASGVVVTDTLPDGVFFVSSTTSQGTCQVGGPIICQLGDLPPDAGATLTIIAAPSATGTFTNRAIVESSTSDSNLNNNSALEETKVSTMPSIFGRVALTDNRGIGDVMMTLEGKGSATVMTSNDGGYQFAELTAGGNYTITPLREGYVFNPETRRVDNLTADRRVDFSAVACDFTISPINQTFQAAGGTGTVTISSPDPRCRWDARSSVSWITITSPTSGAGNGAVTFSVAPTIGSRQGRLTIAGRTLVIRQEFNACNAAQFKLPTAYPLMGTQGTLGATQVLARDFNGDGISDLIYFAAQPGPAVMISLSNQNPGYDNGVAILTGSFKSMHAADLNNDGRADLLLTSGEANGKVSVLLGNGRGGFAPPSDISVGPGPSWIAIDDFNGDGNQDLAVAGNPPSPSPLEPTDKYVSILLGNGTGGFTLMRNISIASPIAFLLQIEAGDFNGDGRKDLAVLNALGSLALLKGDGQGGFAVATFTGGGVVPPITMDLGDFNGDHKTDIAIFNGTFGTILVLVANENGDLVLASSLNAGRIAQGGIVIGDFDDDRKQDLAVTTNDGIRVFYGNGGGRFTEPINYLIGGSSAGKSLVTGDFNRDGRIDLFVPVQPDSSSSPAPVKIAILTSNVQGGFDTQRGFKFTGIPSSELPTLEQLGAANADLNSDGISDLVILSRSISGRRFTVMFGHGRGEFDPPISYPVAESSSDLTVRDFNRDGRPDIALLNKGGRNVSVFINDGSGNFTSTVSTPIDLNPFAIGFADFNSDGNQDLIISDQANGLLLQNGIGNGGFSTSPTVIPVNISQARFVIGDYNGDGNADLIVFAGAQSTCGSGLNRLAILSGNGRGGFSAPLDLNLRESFGTVESSDLNGDGRSDLIFTSLCPEGLGLYVMLANVNGGFASPVRYEITGDIRLLALNDLNGDAKTDVVLADSGRNSLTFFFGTGTGGLTPGNLLPAGSVPTYLTSADFNGDGIIDLAFTRSANDSVTVLLNQSDCAPADAAIMTAATTYERYSVARESIAALFGAALSDRTEFASGPQLPTTLAGATVKIKDSAGDEHLAPLFYASPQQINLLIPARAALGTALVTVMNGGRIISTGTMLIAPTVPGLFSADSTGGGFAAAVIQRVKADGKVIFEPVTQFDPMLNKYVGVPIDVSDAAEQVYLLLFGTGLRHDSSSQVIVKIGGETVETLYAGSQPDFVGLDQVNTRLLPNLAGQGDLKVSVTIDGKITNFVKISIK